MRISAHGFGKLSTLAILGALLVVLQSCLLGGGGGGGGGGNPHTSRGFYTIAFPGAGANLNLDSTYTILWTKGSAVTAPLVNIFLYHGDSLKATVVASAANGGSFSWTVRNSRVGTGTNYHLKIVSTSDTAQWDVSYDFAVHSTYSGTLVVTAPAAGVSATIDSPLTVRWTASGNVGSLVAIHLFKDTVPAGTIITSAGNSGSYTWPAVYTALGTGTNYRIRVSSYYDPAIQGFSPDFRIVSLYNGTFSLTAPRAGDTLSGATSHTLTWTYTGSPGSLVTLQLYRDSAMVYSIASGATLTTGSYPWTVPSLSTSNRYRVKISSYYDAGLFAFSPYFSIKGLSPDAYEPDNVRGGAKVIADSASQSRTLEYRDTDWVQINCAAGKRYSAAIQSGFYLYAYVTDSTGLALNSFSGTNLQIPVIPAYVGKYYLRIQYYSTGSGYQGPYTLNLRGYDSTQSGFPVTFTSPDSNSVWAAGSSYNINWVPDSVFYGSAVSLQLYRDSTLVQSIATGTANDGLQSFTPPLGMLTASNYRIRIVNYNDGQIYAYSPKFTISGMTADAYEPDNLRAGAKAIADSSSQSRTLTYLDTDWVQINAVSGRRYTATVQSTFYVYAYVLDSNGALLNSYSGSNLQVSITPAYTGRHYLRVQYYSTGSGYQGPYTLALRSVDPAVGFPVTFTAPASGATWSAGSAYTINWVPDSLNYGSLVSFQLYRDSTLVQSIYSGTSNNGALSWTLPSGLTTAANYRIRIVNYNDAQVYAFSPSFSISGIAPDSYEPDNLRAGAKAIADSATQSRTLTYLDTDWVQINAASGRRYLASIQSAFYVYAYVLDSNGTFLNSYSGSNLQVSITPTYVGRYYLRVQYYSSGSGYQGPYNLTVRSYDPSTGFPVTFTAPTAGTTWVAGSSYTIGWTPDSAYYGGLVTLQLYRDSILMQSIVTGTANDGNQLFTLPSGLSTGGNYRIRIVNYNNALIYAFSAAFTVSGLLPDAYEPDNVRSGAKVIADSTTQSRNLTYLDSDWVQINAASGKRYLATIQSAFYVYAYVLDSNGTFLNSYSGSNLQVSITPTYVGRYYLRVQYYSSGSGYQGPYNLTVRSYDPSTGFPVTFTAPSAGATWVAGSIYTLNWQPDSAFYGSLVTLQLYRDSTFMQTISSGVSNNGALSWSIPAGLTTGANYRIRIMNYNNSLIYAFSANFNISGLLPDAYEPDNVRSGAKVIADSATQSRNLTYLDSDWVQINVASGKRYLASIQSAFYVYAYVLDSNGTFLNSYSGSNLQVSITPTYTGRHYLRVQFYSTSTGYQGPYSLTLRSFDPVSGFPVTFAAPASGATWAGGSAYTITWQPDSAIYGTTVDLQLYRGTTLVQSIISFSANDGNHSWTLPADLTTANNYRIRIDNYNNTQIFGFSPSFSITGIAPDSLEFNDSASVAASLAPNSARKRLNLAYQDRDWFSFTATAGRIYVMRTIAATTFNHTLALYSAQGTTLLGSSSKPSGDTANVLTWYCPTSGVYTFMINGTSTGNYALDLLEPQASEYHFNVSTPAAGDTLHRGAAQAIRWSSQIDVRGAVDIFLYNAQGLVQTIVANVANNGLYNWTVPTDAGVLPNGNTYYVRIISRIHSVIDGSSGVHSISN